jgi:hypothetical protein
MINIILLVSVLVATLFVAAKMLEAAQREEEE